MPDPTPVADATSDILSVAFPPDLIPVDATIFGLEVQFLWAVVAEGTDDLPTPGMGKQYTLRCQFSKDGVSDDGESKRTDPLTVQGFADVTLGSNSDLWGTTWTPAELNGSNLRLKFWRPVDSDEQLTLPRAVDNVRIQVYYNVPE